MACPASAQAPSPAKLLASSLAACRAQTSVEWISSGSLNGESGTITTSSGRTAGIQLISIKKGESTGHVTVELMNDTGYLKGDSFALHAYMGFTSGAAKKEANRWLSLAPSNMDFSAVTAGLTVSSITSELEMTGPFTAIPESVVLGERVDGVRGLSVAQSGVPAMKSELYVRAKGLPLPVEETQVYEGHTSVVKFVKWNGSIVLEKTPGATPLLLAWLQ
jgi:hypothetical protein